MLSPRRTRPAPRYTWSALVPARSVLLALSVFLTLAVFLAPAARAHEAHGPDTTGLASDARSSVVAHDLPPGVTLDVLQNGQALRLRNDSPTPVTLPEPGLRVPPGASVRWHHDDAHPAPGAAVQPWQVVVEVDGVDYQVLGEVRWTPGPSPWPWFTGAALLAAGLAALARRRRAGGWLVVPLGLAVLSSIVHTGGALAARTAEGSRWGLLTDYLPQAGCWALGLIGVVLLARRHRDGLIVGVLASAGLVLVTLVRDAAVLGASTVLVALPAELDRALVTTTIGLAAGVLAGLLLTRRDTTTPTSEKRRTVTTLTASDDHH